MSVFLNLLRSFPPCNVAFFVDYLQNQYKLKLLETIILLMLFAL